MLPLSLAASLTGFQATMIRPSAEIFFKREKTSNSEHADGARRGGWPPIRNIPLRQRPFFPMLPIAVRPGPSVYAAACAEKIASALTLLHLLSVALIFVGGFLPAARGILF